MSSDNPLDPIAADAQVVATTFFDIARHIADHPDDIEHLDAVLREFYGGEPHAAAQRMLALAGSGSLMAANAIRQLHGPNAGDVQVWSADLSQADSHESAAVQAVLANINGDIAAAHDVMEAHLAVASLDGVEEMAMHLIKMLAGAMREKAAGG